MRARGKGVGISFKIALIFMILSGAFWIILFIQFYYSSDQEAKEYVESLSEQAMSSISKNIDDYWKCIFSFSADFIEW